MHDSALCVRVAGTFIVALACLSDASAQTAPTGSLTVQASGFANAQGHAVAKLFRPGDDVRSTGRWEARAEIQDGKAMLMLPPVPAGRYAVVVFHDANDNGRIDHGLFGPSEALGFSGRFVLSWHSGPPSFEDLAFDFDGASRTMSVNLK